METNPTSLMKTEKMKKNRKAVIEAALFMANEPIKIEKLSRIVNIKLDLVNDIVEEMRKEYEDENHGIHIFTAKGGVQIKVKPRYINYVSQLAPHQDLNKGLLRVLALVAYKQPITQSEIVKVIGNRTYEYVKILSERGFIRTVKTGRTKALIATKEFAEYFGLDSPEDIKRFFDQMTQKKEGDKSGESNEGNERS